MDKAALQKYLDGQREVNRITLEEARALSPGERLRRSLEFREWLESIGKLPTEDQDLHFYLKRAELYRRHLERSKGV